MLGPVWACSDDAGQPQGGPSDDAATAPTTGAMKPDVRTPQVDDPASPNFSDAPSTPTTRGKDAGAREPARDPDGGVHDGGAAESTGADSAIPSQAPSHDDGSCPSELAGWATVSGDGVSTTTGGGNATPVRPTSAAELQKLALDPAPQVIELTSSIVIPRLKVGSNKTIIGIGPGVTITGGIALKGDASAQVSNVILRNLHVDGGTAETEDAVHIEYAHHVWIDHLDIYDGPDGSLDMTHAVNWITVSWTSVRYTDKYHPAEGESVAAHRFASLLGHSDNNAKEDAGRIKVTFHHNFWGAGVLERMPRVRFGQVHVYNNYFGSVGNHYCVRAGTGAQLLIENNYFDGVSSPHEFNNDDDQKTAYITARNNIYQNTTGAQLTGGGGTAWSAAPYAPKLDAPADVPAPVKRCAGPR